MTQHRGTPSPRPLGRPWMIASGGLLALAMLTGCSVADTDAPESEAPTPSDAASSPTTAETSPVDDSDDAASGTASASSTGAATASGDDPVFAAIEAVLGEYPDAVIVAVDREDDDSRHDVEAVVGDRVLELEVLADGTVREDDSDDGDDGDDDDVRRAGEATVTAEEAARAALEGRDGQSVDDMELDDEDDTLVWAVDLDREGGDDGDELLVDATTGEVTQDG